MSTNSRIPLLDRDAAGSEAAAIYDALLEQRGVVPNMFKVLSYSPPIAQGVAGFLKALLSDGALPGWYKELVAVRISTLMQSEYAIKAHNASARKKGMTDDMFRELMAVVGMANESNRLSAGYQVEIDDRYKV